LWKGRYATRVKATNISSNNPVRRILGLNANFSKSLMTCSLKIREKAKKPPMIMKKGCILSAYILHGQQKPSAAYESPIAISHTRSQSKLTPMRNNKIPVTMNEYLSRLLNLGRL
jgi:hypothetical protein